MMNDTTSENRMARRSLKIRQKLVPTGREMFTPVLTSLPAREIGVAAVNSFSITGGATK
jgi:hypothetical protein